MNEPLLFRKNGNLFLKRANEEIYLGPERTEAFLGTCAESLIARLQKDKGMSKEEAVTANSAARELLYENSYEQYEKPITPIHVSQLCKTKPPRDWVVAGLQRPEEIEMDYSDAAGYKSLLAMYRAVCVANGLPFFGLKTKKRPVVIMDNENSIPLLSSRMNRVLKGMNLKGKRFPLTFLIRNGQLDFGDFARQVKEYIIKQKVGLVVVDTARRFHSLEENSSTEMNELYKILATLVQGTTSALLILHHTTKLGDFRGSGDLKGMLDIQIEVKRLGDKGNFQLVNKKNRWGEIPTINGQIVFDDSDDQTGPITFEQHDCVETEQEKEDKYDKFKAARGFIIKFVQETCPMDGSTFRRSDLIENLSFFNADRAKNVRISNRVMDAALKHLVKYKYLSKGDKQGVYAKNFSNKPLIYEWQGQFNALASENTDSLQQNDGHENTEVVLNGFNSQND